MPDETITVTLDDADRLGGIAGELEHLPAEIRRHLDQDGRDARYLRLLEKRIRAALATPTQPDHPVVPEDDEPNQADSSQEAQREDEEDREQPAVPEHGGRTKCPICREREEDAHDAAPTKEGQG